MNFEEYAALDAVALAELVNNGSVSEAELVAIAKQRLDQVNPSINAVIQKTEELASDQLQNLSSSPLLAGVPFLMKDLDAHVKGFPTTNGSQLAREYNPDVDSEIFQRFSQMGLITLGKTNTPELGLTVTTEPQLHGPCKNPWNLDYTTGGSSGGAAAAVAAGIAPMAHASDGGGSIRVPAYCCGLFGLMPSRARNPVGPTTGEGWSGLVRHHVISQTVRDSATVLNGVQGSELGAPYFGPGNEDFLENLEEAPRKLRIKFYTQAPNGVAVDKEVIAAVELAATHCQAMGHEVEEAVLKINASGFGKAFNVIMAGNTLKELKLYGAGKTMEEIEALVEPVTWEVAQLGLQFTAADYAEALSKVHSIGREIAGYHEHTDILINPVITTTPFKLGYMNTKQKDTSTYFQRVQEIAAFTSLANASGQPSMSVPITQSQQGLPIGVQFSAAIGQEALLLRLARQLELTHPWRPRLLEMQKRL